MVRADVARRKIAAAEAHLRDAEALFDRPREEFVGDKKTHDLAAFYVFLAIQEPIDLAAHWIADAGWGPPDDVPSVFAVLAERGVITAELASSLHSAASLCNRIGHGYATLDHGRLYEEFREGADTVRRFLRAAAI
ncbi:MAG TPA: HepT-like ribonuclease domain-containing protein [Thermoanaerobaculia bacterium]|nr:HepT-like ribonuclease domain-containing protein [Thermoanaerobaculia bacterium]